MRWRILVITIELDTVETTMLVSILKSMLGTTEAPIVESILDKIRSKMMDNMFSKSKD